MKGTEGKELRKQPTKVKKIPQKYKTSQWKQINFEDNETVQGHNKMETQVCQILNCSQIMKLLSKHHYDIYL